MFKESRITINRSGDRVTIHGTLPPVTIQFKHILNTRRVQSACVLAWRRVPIMPSKAAWESQVNLWLENYTVEETSDLPASVMRTLSRMKQWKNTTVARYAARSLCTQFRVAPPEWAQLRSKVQL